MTATKKTKLCWNCDGVVDRSSENCLYCGVYLHPEEEAVEEQGTTQPNQPLYQPALEKEEEADELTPAYSAEQEPQYDDFEEVAYEEEEEIYKNGIRGMLLPLVFMLSGSVFMLFSIILLLFAKDGVLTLKWNAQYWFIYLFLAIPLMYIGWRTLQYSDESAE